MWTTRRYVPNVLAVGAHVLRTPVEIVLSRLAAFAHIALGGRLMRVAVCLVIVDVALYLIGILEEATAIGVRFRTPPCST